MRKVFCYIRVSTEEQADHGYSLESQDAVNKDYAHGHQLIIAETFVDTESAFALGRRPEFKKMCAELKRSQAVRTVLCYKLDRIARNMTDFALLTEELGASIISVTEGEVSDSQNQLLGGLHALFARHYSHQLSERVSLGMRTKAEKGLWPSYAPLGYLNRDGGIVPDPDYAHHVRQMFEMYADTDAAITDLVEWARKRGVRSRRSAVLTRHAVWKMLRNPIYHGPFVWKGRTYKGKHEALISKALFSRVQEKLSRRTKPRTKHRFPYKGLLVCGYCGCSLTAERHTGKRGQEYVYYRCSGSKGKCEQPRYTEAMISERLADVIDCIHISPEIVETLCEIEKSSAQEREIRRRARVMQLRGEEQELSEQRDVAYRDKLKGLLTEDRWLTADTELSDQLALVQERIGELAAVREPKWDDLERTFETLEQGPELYRRSGHEFRALQVKRVALNCVVTAEKIDPNYRKPFRAVAEGLQRSDWWSQGDLNPRRRDESPLS